MFCFIFILFLFCFKVSIFYEVFLLSFPLKKSHCLFYQTQKNPAHSFPKLPNFKLLEAGRHERSLWHTGESHTDKFICFDFKRHPRGRRKVNVWLFITVLTLNVVSGFSSLSLLTAPSRFSAPLRGLLASWSYLSIKAETSSGGLSPSPGLSRRCLYLGPTCTVSLILLQAAVSNSRYLGQREPALHLSSTVLWSGSQIFEAITLGRSELHKTLGTNW